MNIKVSHRILGGFAVVIVLLFVIGVSSLVNIGSVGDSANEVTDSAIPTLLVVSEMKLGLIQGQNSVLAAKNASDSSSLQRIGGELSEYEAQVQGDIRKLKSGDNDYISRNVNNLEQVLNQYYSTVGSLQSGKVELVNIESDLSSNLDDVEELVDDISSLILDYAEEDDVLESAALQRATSDLERIDSQLTTLFEVASSILRAESASTLDSISSEVGVQFSLIDGAYNDAVAAAGEEHELLEDISSNISDLRDSISGSGGMTTKKQSQLRAADNIERLYSESNSISAQIDQELASLTSAVDRKTQEISDEVKDAISGSRFSSILMMVLSVVIGAIVSMASIRAITVPLARVNELLHSASAGDLRKKLDVERQDEFGELAENLNKLIDNLKEIISGIGHSTSLLSQATDQTLETINQTTEAVESQKQQTDMVAAATTEMSSTSSAVAANAEDTLKQINHANGKAEIIKDIYQENLTSIVNLADEIETTSNVINKLNEDSVSIGDILEVIRGIAEQTNLLALNAAIEAARAGEQGRGFAVVADEVRTLASRTQESTQKIHDMIQALQTGAEEAVNAMSLGREQAKLSVEKTEQANAELMEITEAVNQAYHASVQIEQSAKEQSVVSGDISEKLENIVMIAEETTSNAKNTSSANAKVVNLTQELQQSISKFKT